MKIITAVLSIILIALALATKVFFYAHELKFTQSIVGLLEIVSLFIVLTLLLKSILKKDMLIFEDLKGLKQLYKIQNLILIAVIGILITSSLHLSFIKKSIDWDAVALYDARAKFIESGMNLSQMVNLSKYDDKNQYYYLLYPPFTTIIHLYWHQFLDNLPLTLLYSTFYLVLGLSLIIFSIKRLGIFLALLLTAISLSQRTIFTLSISEYVNMPFIVFQVAAIFLLAASLKEEKSFYLWAGGIILALTQWIRFLEPIWLMVLIAYFATLLIGKKFKRLYKDFFIIVILCVIQYFSWNFFLHITGSPAIVETHFVNYLEMLVGLFTGSFFVVLPFFVGGMGYFSIIYLAAVMPYKLTKDELDIIFIKIVIVLSLLLYFAGMYAIALRFDWWREVESSFERSSAFLLPLAIYVIIYDIKRIYLKNKKLL